MCIRDSNSGASTIPEQPAEEFLWRQLLNKGEEGCARRGFRSSNPTNSGVPTREPSEVDEGVLRGSRVHGR
eukprot:14667345-Alexandrium_andersonii.AAC.1